MKLKSILLTAVATLGLNTATIAQVPNYVPTNGLVGWWPFNGNANDESGNGNNGTVNGVTLTTDRFGSTNRAYEFVGNINSFIEVANSSSLNITGDQISISTWIFSQNLNTDGNHKGISKGGWGSGGGYELLYRNTYFANQTDNGALQLSGANGGLQQWYDINNINSVWFHLVGVFNNGSGSFYVNGQQVAATLNGQQFTSFSSSNSQLIFGKRIDGSLYQGFVKGKLDDIGIWNRALTQQEVTELYNGNICYKTITVTDTLLINMGITTFNPVTYKNTIKIFPNPTNDHITIDYGNFESLNGYQLKIINSLSQQVFQTNITQQSNYLKLTTWGGNGLYFVQIIDPQGNIIDIRKIMLQ